VLFLVFGEPFRERIMVFKSKSSVGCLNDFLTRAISKQFFGNCQCFCQLINVIIVHFLMLHNLNLYAVFTLLYILL
jgi:hypothetical protein